MPQKQHNWSKRSKIIRQAGTDNFVKLIKMSGLGPANDLRFADWSGVDFSGCDLAGFDFTGSRLCGCNFTGAKIAGARFDAVEIDHVRLYTGDNLGVHDPKHPRMSPLRAADDWEEYAKKWARTGTIVNGGGMINGQGLINASNTSDNHLFTGAVFQDAPFAPEMVVIPPGSFLMGSPDGEGKDHEKPQQEVTIFQRFAISRFAVTFDEYDTFCDATGRDTPKDLGWGRKRRPVIYTSWDDVCNGDKSYLSWLSQWSGKSYRLLSEAEWEYACRAGTITSFSTGDTISKDQAHFSEDDKGDAKQTIEVGSFPANNFGLYDMHGNVWERVEDCYHDSYKDMPNKTICTGIAWTNDKDGRRVLRGGSWNRNRRGLRSAYRGRNLPDAHSDGIGFRVARSLV